MPRSALALTALATTAVPGLDAVATCEPQRVTTDFQTTGVLVAAGRRWVVRCPLSPAAGASFEGEIALLGVLDQAVQEGQLPFDVPRPVGFATLPEGGRLMVSALLRGRPLELGDLTPGPGLSAELGAAIAALHELDTTLIADVGLPVYTADSYRRRCLAEVDEAARTGRVPSVLLNRWERALEDVALWRFRATPVHADLAPEQVLVADGRVTGIVSFSEAHVGDPAEDLAWLMASAPEDALDAIIESYSLGRTQSADGALLDRAMLTSELALARWLLHGVRSGQQSVVEDAVQMLEDLAADVVDAPPIGYHEPVVVPAAPWDGETDTVPVQGTGYDGAGHEGEVSEAADAPVDGGFDGDAADGAGDRVDGGAAAGADGASAPGGEADADVAHGAAAEPETGEIPQVDAPLGVPVTEAIDFESLRVERDPGSR